MSELTWHQSRPGDLIYAYSGETAIGVIRPCEYGRVQWTCFPSALSHKSFSVPDAKAAVEAEWRNYGAQPQPPHTGATP